MSNRAGNHDSRLVEAARMEARALDRALRTSVAVRGIAGATPDIPGYDVVRELHRGGQGVVYLATHRSTGRSVAVKVLRDSRFVSARDRARFEREAALLSRLRHPNIVALHDSGEVDGCVYCVMDYVSGRPLDRYVRDHGLGTPEVMRLFAAVCDGVNAAHLRGFIHRDLKPSNVLVDDAGQPRVLDFGLAKAGEGSGGESSAVTVTGDFVGSLAWASPEQARGAWDRVDVRSDVYSIGVMMYRALSGRHPHATEGGIGELLAAISRSEPARLRSVRRGIDADVEAIVHTCLRTDPERRYQNAGDVARDIRRYLAGEPIEARRDSVWYVLAKTAGRHRVGVAVAAAFVLVVAGGLAGTITNAQIAERQRRVAERERDNALAVSAFLESMLTLADPAVSGGRERTVREMLDVAATMIDEHFAGRPLLEADTRHTLGATYRAVGEHDEAKDQLRAAEALYEAHAGRDDPELYRVKRSLAELLWMDSQYVEVWEIAEEALEGLRRTLGPRHPDTLDARRFALQRGSPRIKRPNDERLVVLEALLGIQREVLDAGHPDVALTLNAIADEHLANGEPARAEPIIREALRMAEAAWGPEHPQTIRIRGDLAYMHSKLLRFEEALRIREDNLERLEEIYGDHILTSHAMLSLSWTYIDMGVYDEALEWHERTTEMNEAVYGEDMRQQTLGGVVFCLIGMGELDEAERLLQEKQPGGTRDLLSALMALLRGEYEETERLLRGLMADANVRETGELILGEALRCQGRFEEAEEHLLKACPQYDGRDYHMRNLWALMALALLYEEWNDAEPARWRAEEAEKWRAKYEERRSKLERAGARIRPHLELD